MHITATSKKHVKTYLREKGWDIYCDKDIKSYYEGSILKNTFGMEKYVATDGENAMFVKSDYQPAPGEVVFYIKRMRSELYCQLYKES